MGLEKIKKLQKLMERDGLDGVILMKMGGHNAYYFTASHNECLTAFIPRDGEPTVVVLWTDVDSVKSETWVKDVKGYIWPSITPPSYQYSRFLAQAARKHGVDKGTIGLEFYENYTWVGIAAQQFFELKDCLPDAKFVDVAPIISEVQSIKSPEEIQMMRKACEIADYGMEAAVNAVKPGVTEVEVAIEGDSEMRRRGMERLGFHTEVGSGNRTELSHAFPTEKKIENGDIVWIDLGADYKGASSNIARTVGVGEISKENRQMIDAVHVAWIATCDALKPGVTDEMLAATCRNELKKHGLDKFMPAYFGHMVGPRYNQIPFLLPKGKLEIKPNMTLGLHGWIFRRDIHVGIFFENTFLVTKDGSEVLTKYPKEFKEL